MLVPNQSADADAAALVQSVVPRSGLISKEPPLNTAQPLSNSGSSAILTRPPQTAHPAPAALPGVVEQPAEASALRDLLPLVAAPVHPRCDTCVVIPARDEADGLTQTLDALAAQHAPDGRRLDPATWEIIVLANNCTDATVQVARAWAAQQTAHGRPITLHVAERHLPPAQAHIGVARRLLMDEAAQRLLRHGRRRGIIVSTDADTLAEPGWLAAIRHEIAAGADAVGGRILVRTDDLPPIGYPTRSTDSRTHGAQAHRARRAHLHDIMFRALVDELRARLDPQPFDPLPRHFQHFGPSIAVTVDIYLRVGGMPTQPWHEDVAFANRLRAADARLRHSPHVRVRTSARQSDRIGFGFAVQLDQWSSLRPGHGGQMVRNPQSLVVRFSTMHTLRGLWQRQHEQPNTAIPEAHAAANALGVDPDWLKCVLRTVPTSGLLQQWIEAEQARNGIWEARWPQVEIEQGITEMRRIVAALR